MLQALPAVITTGMIVTSPWTGFVFTLSPEGFFFHEKLYMPMLLIASLYLIVVAVVGVVNMLRAHTTFQRRSGAAVFSSVLIILLFIFLDTLTTKASILPAAIFSVIVIVFITMQEANINSDALTGMNNRRKADEYLSDKLTSVSEAEPLCLYMGDLDGFKKINDNYGHIEGDEALVICSRVLKRTIGRFNGFAARFGGDEFLLAWQIGKSKETDPESLIQIVTDSLAEEAAGKPYPLSMSIGYVLCTNPKESLSACIKRADEMLYRKKALRGAGR